MAKSPPGLSGTAILVLLTGGALAYSAVKGKSVGSVVRSFIAGDNGSDVPQSMPISQTVGGAGILSASPTGGGVGAGILSASGSTADANKAIAKGLALPFGWSSGPEWNALDMLWTRESGWDNHAENPSSGAYGIPQALPASKLGAAGMKPISSATAQIAWGLNYISSRYGTPSAAWAHETSNGWY